MQPPRRKTRSSRTRPTLSLIRTVSVPLGLADPERPNIAATRLADGRRHQGETLFLQFLLQSERLLDKLKLEPGAKPTRRTSAAGRSSRARRPTNSSPPSLSSSCRTDGGPRLGFRRAPAPDRRRRGGARGAACDDRGGLGRVSRLGEAGAIASQGKTGRWNFWALVALVATALPGSGGGLLWRLSAGWPAELAAQGQARDGARLCGDGRLRAVGLFRPPNAGGRREESGWIRARATAEAIKSECFRFASGSAITRSRRRDCGPRSATPSSRAGKAIAARAAVSASLTPKDDPVGPGVDDRRSFAPHDRPVVSLETNRRADRYYKAGKEKTSALWAVAEAKGFAAGAVIVVVSAAAATYYGRGSQSTGALTTIAAAVTAYGLDRPTEVIAASYAAMKTQSSNA